MYAPPEIVIPLALSLTILCVAERIVNALASLVLSKAEDFKQTASAALVVSALDNVMQTLTAAILTICGLISGFISTFFWALALIFLGAILYVTYEQSPWVWTDLIRSYNAFFGPFLHETVFNVLEISNIVFKGVTPIYNAFAFFFSQLLTGYLLPTVISEIQIFKDLGASIFGLCRDFSYSSFMWTKELVVECAASNGDACFDLSRHTLDLVSPMIEARNSVGHSVLFTRKICGMATPIVDMVTYPIMDLNFATGFHKLANAFLYLIFQLPHVTHTRCTRHRSEGALMCTPDLEPVFDFIVSGIRDMGYMVNNWLNVIYVIVQAALGFSVPQCDSALIPPVLNPGPVRDVVFGQNQTAVVGLTGWTMAITDGRTVLYYSQGSTRISSFPSPVNISYGVAAVSYGKASDRDVTSLSAKSSGTTTSVLGCSCVSSGQRLQIQCSILPFDGLTGTESGFVPVLFQQGSATESLLKCNDIDLSVQAVRWPATRFSGTPTTTSDDCVNTKSCSKVDATVWVIPRAKCGRESTLCDCHPFCMGVRLAKSQNQAIVLYSAEQWRSKVYAVQRDCNLFSIGGQFDAAVNKGLGGGSSTTVLTDGSTAQYVSRSTGLACVDNFLTTSIINRTLHPAYDNPTEPYLRLSDAPFVVSGDTVFTSYKRGDGTYAVRIERLTGMSNNEFSLSLVSENFPASPPPTVPSAIFSQYPKDRLTTPYARQSSLAVSSRDYVFYAVNPATEVFSAYLNYCRNNGEKIDQFGLIMVSSYSPIRIWRVEAYRRCSKSGCGTDLVKQVDIPGAFSDGTLEGTDLSYDCKRTFNEAIVQLEYLNEDNIAVMVKHSSVNGSYVEYRMYWLQISTMLLAGPGLARTGPWTTQVPTTALSAYSLCPAMQRLPLLGSFLAEIIISVVLLIKMPLDLVVYLPGIVLLWNSGTICPLQTRGHTVLKECGANIFLLDDFFDSLTTATNIFWSSLTFLSRSLHTTDPNSATLEFMQNALNGMARYGQGSVDLWTARYQVLQIMKEPVLGVVQSAPSKLVASSSSVTAWAESGFKVSANGLGWARFAYTSTVKILVTIVQNVAVNRAVGSWEAWRILVNVLDEMRDDFDAHVLDSFRQTCAGVSLILGLNNPWAKFVYFQCIAASRQTESAIDLFLSIFNLIPFSQCMCTESAGKVFGEHAMLTCVPRASTKLRPVLLEMVQASRDQVLYDGGLKRGANPLCATMLDYTKSKVVDSVQPWFDAQHQSLDSLAASVDYFVTWFDPNSGKCLDVYNDPSVVVILPDPTDYFHACGGTSLCKSKCSGVWKAFEDSLAASQLPSSYTRTVKVQAESLFFPVLTAEAFTPMKIYTLIQPSQATCKFVCGKPSGDSCLAVAGLALGKLAVKHYCVPKLVSASIFSTVDKGQNWEAPGSSEWFNDVTQIRFADGEAQSVVALTSTGVVRLCSRQTSVYLTDSGNQTDDINLKVLSITDMAAVINPPYVSISISLICRLNSGKITASAIHRAIVIDVESFLDDGAAESYSAPWRTKGTNLFQYLTNYAASQISHAEIVLFPRVDGQPVNILQVTWDSDPRDGIVSTQLRTVSTPKGMGTLLASSEPLSQNCVLDPEGAYIAFVAAPDFKSTLWLSQMRVSASFASSFHSQPVEIDFENIYACDGINSCIGCPDGEVQRLCDAVQQCSVFNCIGTPVNMRKVLCQVGENLADSAREHLALLYGSWNVFVDMMMVIMDLSLQKGLTGVNIKWPDDRFFGYICTVKDSNAHLVSIFTSAINGILNLGHSSLVYSQGRAQDIDSNFNAMSTLPMTALTSFFHQVSLYSLYPMIVAQKILMCRIQGVLAVFDSTGFKITIGDASMQAASDAAVGQCLTANYATRSNNPQDSANAQSAGRIVAQVSQSSALAIASQLTFKGQSLETMMHTIDAFLSYLMGVVSGLADFLQAVDMTHCKLPDYTLNQSVFCACGDRSFQIPAARRREGLAGVGLWCSGTLTLTDASNRPYTIYNPYSYEELQALSSKADAYLACVSSKVYVSGDPGKDCRDLKPSIPALQNQGVSVLTVLTHCKTNYMKKQWDQGAHVLFDASSFKSQVRGIDYPYLDSILSITGKKVAACLADSTLRSTCLQDYLYSLNQDPVTYWSYEDMPQGRPSQYIDSCMVFTGPSNNSLLTSQQLSTFRACLDQYADSNCQLSSMLWTPQSDNAVPVAFRHAVKLGQGSDSLDMVISLKYTQAFNLVSSALSKLTDYSNSQVLTIFFSPEGDIMHQMMDCIFMGPYSNVNYWPQDFMRKLTVPAWFRDRNGTSRALDPRNCLTDSIDKQPPYSCGSSTRQAVIKYFFRDYLPKQQNATLKSIVTAMVKDLSAAWNDTRRFKCLCSDGTTHSLTCCTENSSSWLPPNLETAYQTIPANHILRALTVQLEHFYRYSLEEPLVWTKYLDQSTLNLFNWTQEPMSTVAKDNGLFKADKPVVGYNSSEANSPMDNSALWRQCHGALSQVFFTIPMAHQGQQWMPRNLPETLSGVDALNAFVKTAVHEAMMHSPVYRHYNVSYIPSDSRMCKPAARSATNPAQSTSQLNLNSFTTSTGETLFQASGYPSLPVYGTGAFPIHGCFCGWPGDGETCEPPSQVCLRLPELCPSFSMLNDTLIGLIKSAWDPSSWPCPALDLSDQWAVMDAGELDRWLKATSGNYVLQGEDLLRRGRSGLRVGNLKNLSALSRQFITPSERIVEPSKAVLPVCISEAEELVKTLDIKKIITNLFPVSQGVYESSLTSHCLRYTIESAMLRAMELVESQWGPNVAFGAAKQRNLEALWRSRCEAQISLLSLCKNLDVFKPPVSPFLRIHSCPFSILARDDNDVYMTPGCLVHSGGYFYDPCKCIQCGASKPRFTQFTSECKIAFDPRDMTHDAPLGEWKVSPVTYLKSTFAESILASPTALGNVHASKHWANAEGRMSETGLFCDMISDWWPENQTLPIGYHATTPCSSDETGYRTFDSAFAVERTASPGQFTVVKLVYQHDLTRDATVIDTHFGAGGVCRSSNLGMPLFQTNNMHVCTRQLVGTDTLDPAVPSMYASSYPDQSFLSTESCGVDSSDVPWYDLQGRQDSALHSVGTVPNMPKSTDATYPKDSSTYFGIGPKDKILSERSSGGTGWGESGCSDFEIRTCNLDSECPPDFFCSLPSQICLSIDFKESRCFRHDQCPSGMMCDGGGTCALAHIVYLNNLNTSIEAMMFAEACDGVTSNSYETDGASPWEYVPDWLEGHGMCSNKNWYGYSVNLNRAQDCSALSCSSTDCSVNAHTCRMGLNASLWWPPEQAEPRVFAVRPTVCDRDYEHMRGPTNAPMKGCSPKNTMVYNAITDPFNAKTQVTYSKLFRNYASDATTRFAKMPYSAMKRTGFLGRNEGDLSKTTIFNCESFSNCYAFKFTFNGMEKKPRQYWPLGSVKNSNYRDIDIFRCGVSGYFDDASSKCKIDLKVFPIYSALCKSTEILDKCSCTTQINDGIGCKPIVNKNQIQAICMNIQEEYTADYFTIKSNTENLQALFTMFLPQDGGLTSHVSSVDCFEAIYTNMQLSGKQYYDTGVPAAGVYYPFEFALLEVPLSWIYQCSLLGNIKIKPDSTKIYCSQYENSKTISQASEFPTDQPAFNFDIVQGGYRRSNLIQKKTEFINRILSAVPNISDIPEFRQKCLQLGKGVSECQMLPYCSNSRVWKHKSEFIEEERQLLASLYNGPCKALRKTTMLATLGFGSFERFLDEKTIYQDYSVEVGMKTRQPIEHFIKEALPRCVKFGYNPTSRWPLSIEFDTKNQVYCMDLVGVLNEFELDLIFKGESLDGNAIYTPRDYSPNIMGLDGSEPTECVFPTVWEQRLFSNPSAPEVQGTYTDKRFGSEKCMEYPLAFSRGEQDCKYPTERVFTSLYSHVVYTWSRMESQFIQNFEKLSQFTPPQPAELDFFRQGQIYFSSWKFDTIEVRRYMSNIHPDTSKEVMCTISDATLDFTTCNDANFASLKAHTDSLRQNGPAVVPPASQLEWRTSQAFLASGALFAFANHTRPDTEVLLKTLFDEAKRCGVGEQPFNRVCLQKLQGGLGIGVSAWVPWMSGEWNPYELCDVRLLELNQGNQEEVWPYDLATCPDCDKLTGEYRTQYMFDSQIPGCDTRKNTYAKMVDVEPTAPTNLCYIRPKNTDSDCTHAQGMVGGERGQSVLNHPTIPHLYSYHSTNGTDKQFLTDQAGIYPRGNPILRGSDALSNQYGFLSIPGDEIGVTSIGMQVDTVDGGRPYLRVSKLPLSPESGYMPAWKTKEARDWAPGLSSAFAAEDSVHSKEQSARGNSAWDCPMRRAAFYSQSWDGFSTPVPSPGRSRRLFGNLTGGKSAHPTQSMKRDGSALGNFVTSNGFCYCPSGLPNQQAQCRIRLSDTSHPCSLKRTIDALQGNWTSAMYFTPQSNDGTPTPCLMQFDWPYLRGELRDGTEHRGAYSRASDPISQKCHLLDRLKPFQYRYRASQTLAKSSRTTTDQGGTCHTGRAATLTSSATAKLSTTRCVKKSEDYNSITVACEDGSSMTLSKEKSTPLETMIEKAKSTRTKCSQCSPPPTYTNSKRETIQSESSFGIPFRFSASRAIASDLYSMLCPDSNQDCLVQLNSDRWTSENFLSTLITTPWLLFANANAQSLQSTAPQDTSWSQPNWVFCNTTDALKSSNCKGSIPEPTWRANRFQACYKTIRELTRDEPDVMSSVDVCLIDSDLSNLCTSVKQAQELIKEANCLASGSPTCALKPYLYQPATWDVSNNAFVHQSVAQFYTRVTSYACPQISEEIRANNQAILSRCAATPVGTLYLGLQACRDIVDALAKVFFYLISILVDGLLMAFDPDKTAKKAQIVFYWNSMVEVIRDLLESLSDIFFDMLFHMGTLGTRIYTLVQKSCGFVNKAYKYWLTVWCGIALDLAPMALGGIRQLVEYCEVGFTFLNDAMDSIFQHIVPEALGSIIGYGYDKTFREKSKSTKQREKQVIYDELKKSKESGKSTDELAKSTKKANVDEYTISKGSGISRGKRSLALGILGAASGLAAGLGGLFDIGSIVYSELEMQRLQELYPDNWTLFDFQSIYTVLDTLEFFISSDTMCLDYRLYNYPEILNCTFPPLASFDSYQGALFRGTRCWADAQRDIGTSNLLACSPSDTCYKSLSDPTPIICASCPDPGTGYSQFGCNPLTKICTCSVATTKTSRCISNDQCNYATSTCSLITGLDDMSYGNEPCSSCTKDVQCIVRTGSGIGECGCIFQLQPIQECSQPPGQFVETTSPFKMCGYLSNADLSQSLAVSHWDSLSLVQCSYLRPSLIYCARVYKPDSSVISMAVGLSMASLTSSSYQSRRLLSVDQLLPSVPFEVHAAESEYDIPNTEAIHAILDESDWNGTAAPCISLVTAYQLASRSSAKSEHSLGPLDTLHLHQCAYWRHVGRVTIHRFNLTSLSKNEGFLLSMDDFAAALAQRSVLSDLLNTPEALLFAASHAPALKPLYASLLVLKSWLLESTKNSSTQIEEELHTTWSKAWSVVQDISIWSVNISIQEEDISHKKHKKNKKNHTHHKPTRKLLSQDQTTINFAESWLSGPFSWPPKFNYELQYSQCQIGSAFSRIIYDVLKVLINYYNDQKVTTKTPSKTLRDNLPNMPKPGSTIITPTNPVDNDGYISWIYHRVSSIFGIQSGQIRRFFGNEEGVTNIFTLSTSLLKCDYPAVQFCSMHERDILASTVLFVILYMIVNYYANIMSLPIAATLLAFMFVPIILWYVYGMAFTCFPMIPTCLLGDVIQTLNSLFPRTIVPPSEILISPQCLSNSNEQNCLRSCTESPMDFHGWRETLSFGICFVDVPICKWLAGVLDGIDIMSLSLTKMAWVLENGTGSLQTAHRFCFAASFVNIFPIFILITLVLAAAAYTIYLPAVMISRFIVISIHALVYSHQE